MPRIAVAHKTSYFSAISQRTEHININITTTTGIARQRQQQKQQRHHHRTTTMVATTGTTAVTDA